MAGALHGLKVLDLSILYAAPLVSAMLGDFGADVVKVELPAQGGKPGGDPMRYTGSMQGGLSALWAVVSRNKRSVALDPTTAEGRSTLAALIGACDVLVENLPASTLEAWGCSPAHVSAINPRAVVVSMSCFGATGPRAGQDGNGSLAEAFGGLTHMTGERDGPPMLTSLPLGDALAAFSGVIGAMAASYWRDARGGTGQHVDVSMVEPVLQVVAGVLSARQSDDPKPMRSGSRVHGGVPRNVYRTRDGMYVVVSATTDRQVSRLLPLIGLDTEGGIRRFARSRDRLQNADDLDAAVAAWVATQDRDAALDALQRARLPAVPVNTIDEVLRDLHLRARGSLHAVSDPRHGVVHIAAAAPRLSKTPAAVRSIDPELGFHRVEVLQDWLGGGTR